MDGKHVVLITGVSGWLGSYVVRDALSMLPDNYVIKGTVRSVAA